MTSINQNNFFDEIKKASFVPILQKEEEYALTKLWLEHHDENALKILVKAYIKLVYSIVGRYKKYGISRQDLMQEGFLGLMQAVNRFDPSMGFRFSSYAKWWIKSYVKEFIIKNWSLVKTISTPAQKILFFNLRKIKLEISKASEAQQKGDFYKTSQNLKIALDDIKKVEEYLCGRDFSLDLKIDEEGGATSFLDFVKNEMPNQEEEIIKNKNQEISKQYINQAMLGLTEQEKTIIQKRWLSETPLTLDEVSKFMGLNKEKIKSLEAKSIRKLRFFVLSKIKEIKEVLD